MTKKKKKTNLIIKHQNKLIDIKKESKTREEKFISLKTQTIK